MIGVLAQGRLGNQMFQLAFAYAAAKKLNTDFFIIQPDSLCYFVFFEDLIKKSNKNLRKFKFRNFFKKSNIPFSIGGLKQPVSYFSNRMLQKNIVEWNNTIDENNYFLKIISDNKLYKGFFQSEEYFKDFRNDVVKLFAVKPEFKNNFLTNKKYLTQKEYIAVHIRRTDYIEFGGEELGGYNMTLPVTYYKKCLSLITDLNKYNVVFVSDDLEFVKKKFGNSDSFFFEKNDEITDFQILLNAKKIIIANSSFSWWAAWLNTDPEKIIYAPEYYLGFKVNKYYPAGIKVHSWNWINTNE